MENKKLYKSNFNVLNRQLKKVNLLVKKLNE